MRDISILILFLTSNAFAGLPNWVSEKDIAGDADGKVAAFLGKVKCEAQGEGLCFDMSECNADVCSVQLVNEDDKSKPLYAAKTKVTACANKKECLALIAPDCDAEGVCTNYCAADLTAFVAKDHKSVYCTKFLGFEKHDVKYLLPDAAKKAAKDAAKAADDQKKTDNGKLVKDLKQYFKDWATLTPAEKDDALKKLLKAFLKE